MLDADDRTPMTLMQSIDMDPDEPDQSKVDFFDTEPEIFSNKTVADKLRIGPVSETERKFQKPIKEVKGKTQVKEPSVSKCSKVTLSFKDTRLSDDVDFSSVLNEIRNEKGSSVLSAIRLPQPDEDTTGKRQREEGNASLCCRWWVICMYTGQSLAILSSRRIKLLSPQVNSFLFASFLNI